MRRIERKATFLEQWNKNHPVSTRRLSDLSRRGSHGQNPPISINECAEEQLTPRRPGLSPQLSLLHAHKDTLTIMHHASWLVTGLRVCACQGENWQYAPCASYSKPESTHDRGPVTSIGWNPGLAIVTEPRFAYNEHAETTLSVLNDILAHSCSCALALQIKQSLDLFPFCRIYQAEGAALNAPANARSLNCAYLAQRVVVRSGFLILPVCSISASCQ